MTHSVINSKEFEKQLKALEQLSNRNELQIQVYKLQKILTNASFALESLNEKNENQKEEVARSV
jgi:hypothetical protein